MIFILGFEGWVGVIDVIVRCGIGGMVVRGFLEEWKVFDSLVLREFVIYWEREDGV